MTQITALTLSQTLQQIRQGSLSAVEVLQAYLEQIERLNPALNCYITMPPELGPGAIPPPGGELWGAPLAVKDLFDLPGWPTTAASRHFLRQVARGEAYAVQKLRQAGALILGKLNMHEIALGVTNETSAFGPCRNPWDLNRISGGSSGGSAAAVSAGLCAASLGSDTGGSIRIPAALCGVVGLKPTYGRVSLRGVMPLSWRLDHVGPLTRCVRDAALILQVIAGYDPADPASNRQPVPDYLGGLDEGVKGWRVALAEGDFVRDVDEAVWAAVERAAAALQSRGAQVERVEIPELKPAARANGLMVLSDAAAFHRQRLQEAPQLFGDDVRRRLEAGAATLAVDDALAGRKQVELRRHFETFFENYSLLLLPATPSTAPKIGAQDAVERARQLTRYTAPFNLTGLPALALPADFSEVQGTLLPVGVQLVAGRWNEAGLLCGAQAVEQELGLQVART